MRVHGNREVCIGAGQCVLAAAEVFDQDDEGLVVVQDPTPPAEQHEAVAEAAELCPSGAIELG